MGPLRHAILDLSPVAWSEPTFFAFHASMMPDLVLVDGALTASTEELKPALRQFSGKERIDIGQYSEFIVVGHGLWIGSMLYICQGYRSDAMHSPPGDRSLISDACFFEASKGATQACEAIRVARLLRSQTSAPITLIAAPNPGLGMRKDEASPWFPPFFAVAEDGDDMLMAEVFRAACREIAAEEKITIIPPIAEVSANGVFNERRYCMLPAGDPSEPNFDKMAAVTHGSDDYGAVLAHYL